MAARRVFAGRVIVAFARPSADGRWRVGVTVSRRLRGAVRRNRVRRRLREAATLALLPAADCQPAPAEAGYDVVLIGRPAALDAPWATLEEETARVRGRLGSERP
jgi:ribonuclease P protein component